jgi:hypothetical protein
MRNKGGREVVNIRYSSWTVVVMDVLLSLNFATVLYIIYFLFCLLRLVEEAMACLIDNVLHILIDFIMHQCNCAANHLAAI